MQREFVATYRTLRDNPHLFGGDTTRCALEKIQEFHAPSRALKARIKRHRENRPFLQPVKDGSGKLSQKAIDGRMCNEFFKAQKAALGGTRTVAPAPEPVRPKRENYMTFIEPQAKRELYPEAPPLGVGVDADRAKRDHLVAMGRAGMDIDMFRVLDVFPSIKNYWEAVNNA